jgi:hypothetical protein
MVKRQLSSDHEGSIYEIMAYGMTSVVALGCASHLIYLIYVYLKNRGKASQITVPGLDEN